MKILCICPIGIGNYLLTYPACYAIKKYYPDYSLHLLGLRLNIKDWSAGDSVWSKVHVFDPTRMKGSLSDPAKIIGSLRRERFDASLNFFPSNKWQYNLLPLLSGIPRRVGFSYHRYPVRSLSFLCTDKVPVALEKHDLWQNVSLASAFLGKSLSEESPVFPDLFGAAEAEWATWKLEQLGLSEPPIGFHPGSSTDHLMAAKRWPVEHFAELARCANKCTGRTVLVFGGPEEKQLKDRVVDMAGSTAVHADTPSLKHTAALLQKCAFTVCNDSGLMHMSACMGVPTAAIFGPTDERRNGPVGRKTLAIRKPMSGFPLWTTENVGARKVPSGVDPSASLRELSPQEVWARIEPWWNT